MNLFIHLHLFASLISFLPDSDAPYRIQAGTRIQDVLDQLKIPRETVKLIFINGRKTGPDTLLEGGERVGIFPPIGGG